MKLFYEDEFDALNQMLVHSEKSGKELAAHLFPHLKIDSAYARLRACLNPEKDERLTFGQIITAMLFCGTFDPLQYACDETLHARPDRKAPEDEAVRLVDAVNSAAATMNAAMKAIEQLKKRGSLRQVA